MILTWLHKGEEMGILLIIGVRKNKVNDRVGKLWNNYRKIKCLGNFYGDELTWLHEGEEMGNFLWGWIDLISWGWRNGDFC